MALVYIDATIDFMYTIVIARSDQSFDLHYSELRNFSIPKLKTLLMNQEEEGIYGSFMRGQLENPRAFGP